MQGVPTFPGAGYVEMALAVARSLRPAGPLAVERAEFHRMLTLDGPQGRVVQCSLDDAGATVRIHAGTDDAAWALHATATLGAAAPAPAAADLDAIRRRCERRVAVEDLYRTLARERGLGYGAPFRAVVELRTGAGEALGRVQAPAELPATGDREAPETLVDAALHVLAGAFEALPADERPAGVVVPRGVRRAELRAPIGRRFWVHARIRSAGGDAWEGAVDLLHDDGGVAMRCEGIGLHLLSRRSPAAADWLFREDWRPLPRPRRRAGGRRPRPAAVAGEALAGCGGAAADGGLAAYYRTVEPALNALTAAYAGAAHERLRRTGAAVVDHHRLLWRRLEAIAQEGDLADLDASAAELAARHPDHASLVELVRASGGRLADTICGRADATQWLLSGPTWDALVDAYANAPPFRAHNRVVASVVDVVARRGGRRGLRVLEVGAGTGSTTRAALEVLDPDRDAYLFTDVSPVLVRRARAAIAPWPGLAFGVLDAEREPEDGLGGFDLVLAANVVHATSDVRATLGRLRRLLAPGGLLVVQEGIRRSPWLDLVFGQLEGWWSARDLDLRAEPPLMTLEAWRTAFAASGLDGLEILADDPPGGGDTAQAVLIAAATRGSDSEGEAKPGPRRWAVVPDGGGVARRLAARLRDRGDRCEVVASADVAGGADGLIHLGLLDPVDPERLDADAILATQTAAVAEVASLARGAGGGEPRPRRIWLVSAGAVGAGDDPAAGLAAAGLWGAGRVLRNERADLGCRLVDLGAECTDEDLGALIDELDDDSRPHEVALRDGRPFERRLARAPLAPEERRIVRARSWARDAFRLEIDAPGALENLVLRDAPRRAPDAGEVEISVKAAALNFKDVLVALGMVAVPDPPALGMDCVGVVTACGPGVDGVEPGDEVVAVSSHTLGSRVIARQELVAPCPEGFTAEEIATTPGAFGTALRALRHLARLRAGERVLIHSAAGGVGLAAVQVAQLAGAEILATAGTPERRAHLAQLGVSHVMDSRSPAWFEEAVARTGGEGVDVVLNSLGGEAIGQGLRLLRPYGRFVEIGRRDIQRDAPLGLLPFERSLTFHSLQLDRLAEERPDELGALLREILDGLARGELEPLPHTVFDLADAEVAFRHMGQARHIGRIVLAPEHPTYRVAERPGASPFRADGTYLLVGGLGGLGLRLAIHLARRGARHLVLASRSGAPHPDDAPALRALGETGAEVRSVACDATDARALARLLADVRETMPPIRGVVHAAAVVDNRLLDATDDERIRAVLAPKVAGAWNLHRLTRDDPLDLFVLFSSFSAVLGPPGQGGYAAANAFLGALARHRRALGLPALALDLGAVGDAGLVVRSPEVSDYLDRLGLRRMATDDVWRLLEQLLQAGAERRMMVDVDWDAWHAGPAAALRSTVLAPLADVAADRAGDVGNGVVTDVRRDLADLPAADRAALVEDHVRRQVARVLDAAPAAVEIDLPLVDLGLDSLMAVELVAGLQQDLGLSVAIADVLEWASVRDLAALALGELAGNEEDRATSLMAPARGAPLNSRDAVVGAGDASNAI